MDSDRWCAAIVDESSRSAEFALAARWFDAAFVVSASTRSMWIKVYAGRVIDVVPGRGVFGYAFELLAPDAVWHEAFEAPAAELQRLIAERKVEVRGNMLEFMRLARALDFFVEILRTVYLREGGETGMATEAAT
jgi:hypothetical protein